MRSKFFGEGYAFRDIMDKYEFVQNMSLKGNCWDNAVAESFFKTLKSKETDDRNFKIIEEAKRVVFNYIEVYYNRQRIHSSIQYQIPAEYEPQWLTKKNSLESSVFMRAPHPSIPHTNKPIINPKKDKTSFKFVLSYDYEPVRAL